MVLPKLEKYRIEDTCTDYSRCWEVGTLLVRVAVLGNEAAENRNVRHFIKSEEIVGTYGNIGVMCRRDALARVKRIDYV